ncbi:hypothetical protein HYFRA_00011394 [Hymenoscyphus fraxineus]|uniref:Uncharacterized protein n=1 Tax=Hymenoscyphus fraxineus TaxID=746836 RepID=A0A9N9PW53_9HELO|nr:hypothetical protein HYFRA_00011394 [Hymenoscyphus fraxineus]
MCLVQATTFICKHTVTKSTDCALAERASARHTISRRDLTSTELCPECRPSRPKKYQKSRSIKNIVFPKLRRARRATKTFSSQTIASLGAMISPPDTKLAQGVKKQPPQKLDAKAIKSAQSLTGACLRSTKSNADVLAMINKELAKKRPYAASLVSSSSSDSSIGRPSSESSQVGDRRSSTPTGKDLAWLSGHVGYGPNKSPLEDRKPLLTSQAIEARSPTPLVEELDSLSGKLGYGPNQSPLDDRKPLLSSQAIETRAPTPPVQELESLSGYVAYSPNQSSLDGRNKLPSQRPTNHKSTASMPNLLRIGTGLVFSTEEDPGASARRGSRAEEQAKEFHYSCYNGSSSASPSAHVELPGSEIPQVPSHRTIRYGQPRPAEVAPSPLTGSRTRSPTSKSKVGHPSKIRPTELAVPPPSGLRTRSPSSKVGHPSKIQPTELATSPVPSSRTRSPTSKASHPSTIPTLLQPGYVEPDRTTKIYTSPIPASLKPGYQEPDYFTRTKPFTQVPDILLTAPTPSPSPPATSPTVQPLVSKPPTPNPILTSKRGVDYQTLNSRRSKNEIMRNGDGTLIPRFTGQVLPIISVQPTHREQNRSVPRNSLLLDADLQDTEMLFEFADEYSARGRELTDARGTGRVCEPHYGFLKDDTSVVDDKSSSQKSGCRQSWDSGDESVLLATKMPLMKSVHGPKLVDVKGAGGSLEGLGVELCRVMGWPGWSL